MGVLNITPDSFSDGGLWVSAENAIHHAKNMVKQGADIVDIGGESTRPCSKPVSADEEIRRIMPVIEALVDMNISVSVDTSKPEVMRASIEAGAAMINDVKALQAPGALQAVAEGGVAACLMHMQGEPGSMQANPHYGNVVTEVKDFLRDRVHTARAAGIPLEHLVIDPGFGFGKTLEHNIALLRHLDSFLDMGVSLMVGLSRKSMLGKITGSEVGDRVHASVAAALLALMKGAKIIRVHDVKATSDAIAVYNAVNG
ncbi:MAG TPA: dihydropteroate synthase [Nitrosospira sp.]|nr:dihydropteroate synthase [Nitrosospira sp.]